MPEKKKFTCHLFVMILSPLSYLHIKALIKIVKGQNAFFKTDSRSLTELVLFFISVISLDSDVFTLSISTPRNIFTSINGLKTCHVSKNVYKCVIFKLS